MRVSFTGTRRGMSDWQKYQLEVELKMHGREVALFAHGACIGADLEAHAIMRKINGLSMDHTLIAVFPSTADTKGVIPEDADWVAEPKPPLDRNRDIVDCGRDMLIAAPLQMHEVMRSGTWAAVRYAKKKGVEVKVLLREQNAKV